MCDSVLTTIETNNSQGPFFDQFLVMLEGCLPQHDYDVRESYASLIKDRLGERISKFADPLAFQKFNPPAGITDVLIV